MSACRFILRLTASNHRIYCRAPGKKVGGTVRCFEHWPAVCS